MENTRIIFQTGKPQFPVKDIGKRGNPIEIDKANKQRIDKRQKLKQQIATKKGKNKKKSR